MTIKKANCILVSLYHAKEIIENLACENYPYTAFEDAEISEMFYQLNDMCITMHNKIDALKSKGV